MSTYETVSAVTGKSKEAPQGAQEGMNPGLGSGKANSLKQRMKNKRLTG